MKLKKEELSEIIMETIYDLIKEGDETLINLMRETESVYGDDDSTMMEWVEKTTSVLEENLNIQPEIDEAELMTEQHIEMLSLAGVLTEGVDKDAARELELYIDNDGKLYNSQYLPILKNLSKKFKKGKYDKKLAVKLWMYLVDAGAKKYADEYGSGSEMGGSWHNIFNKATRLVTATELEKTNRDGIEDGDYL